VLKYHEESKIRDAQTEYIKKAVIFIGAAVLHGLLFYLLLQAKFNYRIYRYDRSGVATAVFFPRDAVPFSKAPKSGALVSPVPEPLIVKPGQTTAGTGTAPAKETPAAKLEPPAPSGKGGDAGKSGPPSAPAVELKGEAPAERGGAASSGLSAGFGLTYSLGSQLKLTKPAETSIDEILRPGRYRTRTDIDFSKYLRPEPGAMAPSGRIGIGKSGTGGGGGGHGQGTGRGASVTLNVARYDLVPWAMGVMTQIQKNWTLTNPEDSGYRVEVRISVMMARNGELLAMEIETSSKVGALDQAALHALQASGPFPALPADFPKSSLDMVFVFQYGY